MRQHLRFALATLSVTAVLWGTMLVVIAASDLWFAVKTGEPRIWGLRQVALGVVLMLAGGWQVLRLDR